MENNKTTFLVLSGRICTGKSTLANLFKSKNDYEIIMTRDILKRLAPATFLSKFKTEREGLINYSLTLDREQDGKWIAENITLNNHNSVIDSVRLVSQLQALKYKFTSYTNMLHVYLKASDETLSRRFAARNENKRTDAACAILDFNNAKEHDVELKSNELEQYADIVLTTDLLSIEEAYNCIHEKMEGG
jgi:adenylosuccinate synthase